MAKHHLIFLAEEKLFELFNKRLSKPASLSLILLGTICSFIGSRGTAATLIMAACRYSNSALALRVLLRLNLLAKEVIEPLVTNGISAREAAGRSIIIKWPVISNDVVIEKGILIITFTKSFSFYLRNVDILKMANYFHFVLEPSWSGYVDPDILAWSHLGANRIFVQATEEFDRVAINTISPNLIPLSFGASNWVDHKTFSDLKLEKLYDSIYVANTTHAKRVLRYLRAVKRITNKNPRYKACMVCAGWGGQSEAILKLIKYYDVSDYIDVKFSVDKKELTVLLNRSKVNILLSLKEGSNRSLFESMFCNTPVICISENIGVNKSYINENTGVLIPDIFLEHALLYMADQWKYYAPRKWALENISPEVTTEKLATLIRRWEEKIGAEVEKIYVKTNNPEVSYFGATNLKFSDINENVLSYFELNSAVNFEAALAISHDEFLHRISNLTDQNLVKIGDHS